MTFSGFSLGSSFSVIRYINKFGKILTNFYFTSSLILLPRIHPNLLTPFYPFLLRILHRVFSHPFLSPPSHQVVELWGGNYFLLKQ